MRFLNPPTVAPDGTCPGCGRPVEPGGARAPATTEVLRPAGDGAAAGAGNPRATGTEAGSLPAVPWHFKALVGALAVYLGYRFFEMGEWLVRRL